MGVRVPSESLVSVEGVERVSVSSHEEPRRRTSSANPDFQVFAWGLRFLGPPINILILGPRVLAIKALNLMTQAHRD